jgi:peptide/nickel transport system permease protein
VKNETELLAEPSSNKVLTTKDEARISVASQKQLMWWRFRKHKMAVIGGIVVIFFYLIVIFADFVAYSDPNASDAFHGLVPPQQIHPFDHGGFNPYIHPVTASRDLETFKLSYTVDESTNIHLRFFGHGFPYKFLGIFPTDIHLIGVESGTAEESLFILGTDSLGRDLFSRLIYAIRTSLLIGLVGVVISLFLGVFLGAICGFYGGLADNIISRIVEILSSIPTLPLWLGLAAAMPKDWSIYRVYFAITIIISIIGWTGLSREVRARFLSIRDEDFVTAAELSGCRPGRIMRVHMFPLITSHIIATATLSLPGMIGAETALSFLGLGLRPPAISLGVLLEAAQNIQTVALSSWLMIPAIPLIIIILSFNFLGDGLRDAADPYGI